MDPEVQVLEQEQAPDALAVSDEQKQDTPEEQDKRDEALKAVWSTASVNDLPDSSFLYIEPGGDKDEQGRTVPRSLRHFPVKDSAGKPDLPHVRNALSRLGQSGTGGGWLTEGLRKRLVAAAQRLLAGGKSTDPDDLLLAFGSEVKMQADGRVSGYLVRFTDEDNPDLDGEYFDKATDYALMERARSPIYYHHGQDPVIQKRVIGDGALTQDDVGIWLDGQLKLRDKWEQAVRRLGQAHKLTWSSGTATHLVERDQPGPKATHISRWPLGLDASLTLTPAEPLNKADLKTLRAQPAQSLKALAPEVFAASASTELSEAKSAQRAKPKPLQPPGRARPGRRNVKMLRTYESGGRFHVFEVGEEDQPIGLPLRTEDTKDAADAFITDQGKPDMLRFAEMISAANAKSMEALLTRMEAMQQAALTAPARKGAALTQQETGEEVKTVAGKTFSDFIYAILEDDVDTLKTMGASKTYRTGTKSGQKVLGEQTGPAGAYLVPEVFIPELIRVQPESEIVYPRADRQSVRGPIRLPGLSTAGQTAGRTNFIGGVVGGWTEAGEHKPATEPEFTQIALNPWEWSGYCPIKDELLDRSVINLPNLLTGLFREAMGFYRDEAFLDGTGAGQPLGIIPSPGTYIETRVTAGHITWLDLVHMKGHLLPQSWNNAHWIFSISDYEDLITMQDPAGHYIWLDNARDGEPTTILGLPFVFTEKTPILGSQGDVILADERFYYVAEEGGVAIASSQHVYFLENRTVFKFFFRIDGQEKLPAPIYLKDGHTQVSPFVILGGAATT
ncbi:MAG TPA: phage major capsid protein [Anaerolineae bacterium]|nr:phage major capsid protein [Anaerolineae bacterium]